VPPQRGQYRKFRLEDDQIHWKSDTYPISSVTHLKYQRVLTTQRMNLVKVGEARSSYLTISMNCGVKIKLSFNEATLFLGWNRDKTRDLMNIDDLHRYLARVTFQQRLEPFLDAVERTGEFEYDGCRFIPREKKIVFRTQEFIVGRDSFLRGVGYVELRPAKLSLSGKLRRELSFKLPHFNTQTDTDVIFALLDHYFGLKWK